MRLILRFLLGSTMALLISCAQSEEQKNAMQFVKAISGDPELPSNMVYIIIPATGCVGCISPAISFMKENIKSPIYRFVFTEIYDTKLIKSQLGKDYFDNPKLILDFKNLWRSYKLAGSYPLIITIRDGEIKTVTKITTDKREIWTTL